MKSRAGKRMSASRLAPQIITIDGDKALRDKDVAALFGISLATLYERIGRKLWRIKPRAYYKLPAARDRGRLDRRPGLAFTQAGVLLIAGILGDDDSLEIGLQIADALRTRRRSSTQKKRPARRTDDAEKKALYDEAKSHLLKARMRKVPGRTLH